MSKTEADFMIKHEYKNQEEIEILKLKSKKNKLTKKSVGRMIMTGDNETTTVKKFKSLSDERVYSPTPPCNSFVSGQKGSHMTAVFIGSYLKQNKWNLLIELY